MALFVKRNLLLFETAHAIHFTSPSLLQYVCAILKIKQQSVLSEKRLFYKAFMGKH
jgi:hypothetical protein